MVNRETGETIGKHRGLWFHTIGQRKGVGPGLNPGYVNLGPWYVSDKDLVANVLEVTNHRDAIEGPRESFQASGTLERSLQKERLRVVVSVEIGRVSRDL